MSTEVREVPGRGRCLFAAVDIPKGDTFLSEVPCFVSKPEDQPAILAALESLHEQEAFVFGHLKAHYAAVLSYYFASQSAYDVVLARWAPTSDGRLTLQELERILAELERLRLPSDTLPEGRQKEDLTPTLLHQLVMAWEYNGFSGDNNALLMYDQISTASHSCDPNCDQVVLYGLFRPSQEISSSDVPSAPGVQAAVGALRKGDVFERRYAGLAFRANRALERGEEITFSYCLTAEDLAKDFQHRRKQLNLRGWQFVCGCRRCTEEVHAFLNVGRDVAAEEVEEDVGDGDMCALFDGI